MDFATAGAPYHHHGGPAVILEEKVVNSSETDVVDSDNGIAGLFTPVTMLIWPEFNRMDGPAFDSGDHRISATGQLDITHTMLMS